MSVQRRLAWEVVVHGASLASARPTPVHNHRTDPIPLDRMDQAIGIDPSLVLDELFEVLVGDLCERPFLAQ